MQFTSEALRNKCYAHSLSHPQSLYVNQWNVSRVSNLCRIHARSYQCTVAVTNRVTLPASNGVCGFGICSHLKTRQPYTRITASFVNYKGWRYTLNRALETKEKWSAVVAESGLPKPCKLNHPNYNIKWICSLYLEYIVVKNTYLQTKMHFKCFMTVTKHALCRIMCLKGWRISSVCYKCNRAQANFYYANTFSAT